MRLYSELAPGSPFPPFQQIVEQGYFSGTPEPAPDLEDDEDADEEGGCGCGENCDRGAGDACPLDTLYDKAEYLGLTRQRINAQLIVPGSTVRDQLRIIWKGHGFEATWNFICLFGLKRQ